MKYMTYEEIKKVKILSGDINEPAPALGGYSYWYCPRCKKVLDSVNGRFVHECLSCGQMIRW